MPAIRDLDTPHGPARAHLFAPAGLRRATLVLGHGAGGSITAPDLQAVTIAAVDAGNDGPDGSGVRAAETA